MPENSNKPKYIATQLIFHLPFSVFGVMLALLSMGFLTFIAIIIRAEDMIPAASQELFHVFHASHILISSVATTAMFRKHDNSIWKALIVGIAGSVLICGISDYYFPYIGGLFIESNMHLHICLIEEPMLVLSFAVVGTLAGLGAHRGFEKATQYSHSFHVFVSSVASLLYLMSFGLVEWTHAIGAVFAITILAVMLPCCLSDIVFPLMCSHSQCRHTDVMEEEHVL